VILHDPAEGRRTEEDVDETILRSPSREAL
jgi:hypothetical protein